MSGSFVHGSLDLDNELSPYIVKRQMNTFGVHVLKEQVENGSDGHIEMSLRGQRSVDISS